MSYVEPMRRYLFKLRKHLPKFLKPAQVHKPNQKQLRKKARQDNNRPQQTALLVAYSGKNYHGLNFNWDVPTVEYEILKALHNVGVVPPLENMIQPKVGLQRVSRTDKGVSAAGNIVLLRLCSLFYHMLLNQPNLLPLVNEQLPPDIKLIDYLKAPRNFRDHTSCTQRTYSYTLPTYAFAPLEQIVTPDYRMPLDVLERVNEVLEKFWGAHTFHNYTMSREAEAKDPRRYIFDFDCGIPFVVDSVEFCVLTLRGPSFLLNQIRKMIGMTIAVVRGFCDKDAIELSWEKAKVDIPKAPGLGLMLEKLHFPRQEDLFGGQFVTEERKAAIKAQLDDYRENTIRADIISTELQTHSMLRWMKQLHFHSYDVVPLDGGEHARSLYIMLKRLKRKRKDQAESSDIEGKDTDELLADDFDDVDIDSSDKHAGDELVGDGANESDLKHLREDTSEYVNRTGLSDSQEKPINDESKQRTQIDASEETDVEYRRKQSL